MKNERLDLTDKNNWLNTTPEEITTHFGYNPDENFKRALKTFKEQIVSPA